MKPAMEARLWPSFGLKVRLHPEAYILSLSPGTWARFRNSQVKTHLESSEVFAF